MNGSGCGCGCGCAAAGETAAGPQLAEPVQVDPALAARYAGVQQEIAAACTELGRSRDEVTLIAVTKFHPASLVAQLAALGQLDVGENRHQEAQEKAAELTKLPLRWHFIGQLQTKKARQAARYAHAIHSIDRAKLVSALATAEVAKPIDAFLQVNLTADPGRGGARPEEIPALAEQVLETSTLRLRGLMAVAPLPEEEEAASAFARLRGYADELLKIAPDATALSAGMTADFREALAIGATHLRIGSAITGKRPAAR